MGLTRTDNYSIDQNQLSKMMKVISHPARIAILQYIIDANQCIGNDLLDVLGLAQPTISLHLKELKLAGLIKGTIRGTSLSYCINKEKWDEYRDTFSAFFVSIDEREQNC